MTDTYQIRVDLTGNNQLSGPLNQATGQMRQLSQEAKNADNAVGKLNGGFNQMQSIMGAAFMGVSVAGVAKLAEELYATGMEAQRATALFESYNGVIGDTATMMDRLRKVTRGTVSDLDLMNGANKLLSMGLAKNADELEQITNIAITYAQAMGEDVGGSLDNVAMILANQSFQRLDSLGINSGDVRALAEQYKAAGMESGEAFNRAFIEIAEGKLPQMTAVAESVTSPLEQLAVSWDNFWTAFGNRFATGVNTIIGGIEHLDLIATAAFHGDTFAQARARYDSSPTIQGYGQYLTGMTPGVVDAEAWQQFYGLVIAAGRNSNKNPTRFTDEELATFLPTLTPEQRRQIAEKIGSVWPAIAADVRFGPYQGSAADWSHIGGQIPGMSSADRETARQLETLIQIFETQRREIIPAFPSEGANWNSRWGFTQYFDDGRYQQLMDAQANAQINLNNALSAKENGFAIPDETIEQYRNIAEYSTQLADNATMARTEFENMSLAQALGQSDGGRLGELTDIGMAYLRGQGLAEGLVAGLENQLNVESGRETVASMWVEKNFGPNLQAVLEQYGTEAAAAYMNSMNAEIDRAQATMTPFNPANLLYQPTGNAGGGGSYTAVAGDTLWGISQQYGVPVDQLRQMAGLQGNLLPIGTTFNFGGGGEMALNADYQPPNYLSEAETSSENISNNLTTGGEEFQNMLDAIFGKEYNLVIKPIVDSVPTWFKALIEAGLAEIVAGNGGVVPGTSGSTGRSGTRNSGNQNRQTNNGPVATSD
jgi:hypothetical protein